MSDRRRLSLARAAGLAALAALFCGGCASELVPNFDPPFVCRTKGEPLSAVYLIGDAGAPKLPSARAEEAGDGGTPIVDPVLAALATRVSQSVAALGADRTMVLFLGDNIYPKGMPPEGARGRRKAERILDAQAAAVGAARGVFILGNHDWNQGDEDGYERAMAQIRYLHAHPGNISVEPHNGCPGPSTHNFGANLLFVYGDLWSAIYGTENPDSPPAMCVPPPGEGRMLSAFREIFQQSRGRRVILAIHPPVMTSGPHGGYFPWREHLFPLRVFHRDLWIPIPLLGSLFPISRILGVTDTDLMGSNYQIYIEGMKELLRPGAPTLVVAGHEHSLQIHVDPLGVFHAVSGAGSTGKVDYVRDMRSDLMSLAAPGFMRLDEYADGTLTLTVIALGDDQRARPVFHTCIP